MNEECTNDMPLLEEIKTQTKILLPILKVLREEFGDAKTLSIMKKALCPHIREVYLSIGERKTGNSFEKWNKTWDEIRPRIGENVEREFIVNNNKKKDYNVKKCKFAEYFREINEPELGKILMCDFDYYVAEIGKPVVELTRTKTLMDGDDQCDFRYVFNQ